MATENAPEYTPQERISNNLDSLLGNEPEAEATPEPAEPVEVEPQETEEANNEEADSEKEIEAESQEDESTDDDSEEGVELTLENLARHYGVEVDDLYENLALPTKVNGEEGQVPLKDLVKSYQLESAINQKSMKLSDELKQTEQEKEQIRQERELYQNQLKPFLEQLGSLVQQDQQVDWAKLAEENPQKYLQEKALADQRAQAYQQSEQQYQYMRSLQLQEHLARESAKLTDLIPEWKDPEVKKSEATELTSYMKNHGYSDQDIESITYGKAEWIDTIRKAYLYDKSTKNVESKRKVSSAPKLKVKPGPARSSKEDKSDQVKTKFKKLRQTGKADDAASLIHDLL